MTPTRHTADRTRLSCAARSSRISATSLDREYPIAADAETRSTGASGAVPLAMDATVDTLDTKSTRALCRDEWASWTRLATPWMCGRNDCNGQLKLTGHWLSGECQLQASSPSSPRVREVLCILTDDVRRGAHQHAVRGAVEAQPRPRKVRLDKLDARGR